MAGRQVLNARIVVDHNGEARDDVEYAVARLIRLALQGSDTSKIESTIWPVSVEVSTAEREG